MTANRGLFVRNLGAVGTTPIEGRLVMASLVAENSPGNPRNGLLDQKATTVVSGTASMTYSVGPCNVVVNRAAGEGAYIFSLTGTTTVATTAAPGTGSRWDLIYVKQNDPDKGDASNTAVLAVLQGTSSTGTPTKPTASLPAGAYVLAEARVYSGATATNGAQVTITQTWRYTALRGAPVPVRSTTERDEITPAAGYLVKRLDIDNNATEFYTGSAWQLFNAPQVAKLTGGAIAYPANTLWGPGTLTLDSAGSKNPTFIASTGSDGFTVSEPGVYMVTWMTLGTGSVSAGWTAIKNNDESVTWTEHGFGSGMTSWNVTTFGLVYAPTPNYFIRFRARILSSYNTTGSTVYVAKIS
ncbi:minor tail protein [Arthrobacter phage DrManhattan]|uniref:Minor tail protein n=2 Tax=Manhattanvirus drmanhattan TaxID=2734250 RepID=A0A3G2KFK6_9CAUD|nr:virion structural protein [Arthrobacter phage DrManhattan]AYN57740.1 minor tail protein [Arthrobacter phage DrManhattan]QHB36602.1 minor tail protein [Arthrobacter phage Adolin]